MAENNVSQWNRQDQSFGGVDWEEASYREGCAYARERATVRLKELDDRLLRSKPKGLRVEGFRERTVVTRFAEVVVRRRMYRDQECKSVFALDESLGWKSHQSSSPSLAESVVSMATVAPFRVVARLLSALTAGVLSAMTIHRLLSRVCDRAMEEELERWEACFERGEDVCDGQSRAEVLYTEADGVWVHLQREERDSYEVKSAIAYSGWKRVGDDRYELVGKRMYGHASERMGFWEGGSLEWGKSYDLGRVRLFVVGSDGANWIRSGVGEFGDAVFQLDGFHLSRACGRGYGAELGSAIYEAIRSGQTAFARSLMSAAAECETKTELRYRKCVESNAVSGMDWRNQVSTVPANARSLGTMEANGDKTTANRMKKRGMSWTIRGARRMVKAIQLDRNGELSGFCRHRAGRRQRRAEPVPTSSRRLQTAPKTTVSDWVEATVPALNGPHSSRPWTQSLRNLIHSRHRLS